MFRNLIRFSRFMARKEICCLCPKMRQISLVKSVHHTIIVPRRFLSANDSPQASEHIEPAVFEEICNETLESLCDYFDKLVEDAPNLKGADVTYSDGVLTVALGSEYGTYVINRQTPNKQIWLSSPFSGPKRYDLVLKDGGYWIYKHDGVSLHRLLQEEISKIVVKAEFKNCAHSLV